ncbi:hypothetical protein A3J19_05535 [Candidatus Daviesbacteria bacterium RIFCSPLOWO2_02_FULL_41_8]|uniref:DUF4012 domain-containing protein n=3 Tax=Candidatus Daviesiibacteriota TaxID=1752718 RepID=A0A1F5NIH1_9BACT|nr:MAG: hypothetical protein A2871_03570 [Candidatus Daviesbacteria bacterium RIFCSPHIGHO2_01_FULL_41_23]OGE32478.1 MAG: hypothetical protein A3D83_02415 [Candidatus Daviesbacteria bacterium RIFCSPHIGHO2_02_FULL_41_10]OGE61999.1 MAG: hypothetical protein A2967_03385 [Candidatus Daviesbacteria bacterium RIFCSPLOWO2_01_FULL_41_32]OGE77373.1 MAG: hypothetical protein A3J19_05535 [Candidatus Daviesbacteria bacterium RIFCSPLOWO2_02_FULL_41_8]
MFVNLNKKLKKEDKNYLKKRPHKGRRRLFVILIIFLLALIIPSVFAYFGLKETSAHAKGLVAAYKGQQFDNLRNEVQGTKIGLQKLNISLGFLFWFKLIPFAGGYYSDVKGFVSAGVEELTAVDKILSNLESAKGDLRFDGNPKSGPERVTQALNILNKSLPVLDQVESNFTKAANSVRNIDTNKYPEKFKGKLIRKNLEVAKNFILGGAVAMKEGKNALSIAPGALGIGGAKNYLLLFQNDKEIRPTGGFLTAFATMTINNGQVSATTSDDIYRLDEKLLNVCLKKICPLTPPAPIVKYLPEVSGKPRSAWSMRDSNISPDVPTSAKEFERMYQMLGEGLPFDGIIFIDSQVVEELIEVTGKIDVFGTTYSAEIDKRCNCPNVIYELESYAEIAAKGEKDRKAVLGILMQQILARSVGADVEKLPQLVEVVARLANHKHVMFYMHDGTTQKALSALNWTGEIQSAEGDYLHINDANFAGGKSNLYVKQTVTQEISPQKDGTVKKKIIVEYKNDQPFGIWLNGINRDYVRFYVPKGSKLFSSKGSESAVSTIEDELGKTVFEAFIQVRPQNARKLEIEYSVPYKPDGQYKLMVQKQPGAQDFRYIIKINGSTKADFKLDQDKEFKFEI